MTLVRWMFALTPIGSRASLCRCKSFEDSGREDEREASAGTSVVGQPTKPVRTLAGTAPLGNSRIPRARTGRIYRLERTA